MAEVAAFLGLPPFEFKDVVRLRFNTSSYPGYSTASSTESTVEVPGQPDIQWLREFFREHNASLATHINKGCSWTESE